MSEEPKQLFQQVQFCLENNDRLALGRLLGQQRTSDIAEIVELLDNEQRRTIFDLLDKPTAADVLEKVDQAARAQLFELLREEEIKSLVSELDLDDAADLLAEMPKEISQKVLRSIEPTESAEIVRLMSYSKDSAGGIMDPVLISVREDATVAEAVNKIRQAEIDEDFFTTYVVDKHGRFLGDVRIRYMLTSPENTLMIDLVDPNAIYVPADADQEEVRNVFSKNDLIVVPVLDKNHRLVGRITADRIIEVAEEEAFEDIYTMAGTDTAELRSESIFTAARVRMTWLFPCMFGTAVTALIGMFFRSIFFESGKLYLWAFAVVFSPMVAAISGNAGLQTSAIVVSGLASGHLAALRLREVFQREVSVALLVAACCGLLGAAVNAFLPNLLNNSTQTAETIAKIDWPSHIRIIAAFGSGMFAAVMVATTLGLFLPFLFRRIGIDPVVSSGPLVTTANDSISVAIYMTLTVLLVGLS